MALNCDPIKGMAKIAMNKKNPVELRASMYKELAQYIAPKGRPRAPLGEFCIAKPYRTPAETEDTNLFTGKQAQGDPQRDTVQYLLHTDAGNLDARSQPRHRY